MAGTGGVATGGGGTGGTGSALPEGDLFTADYASDTGNWDTQAGLEEEGVKFNQGRIAGGGPKGLDAFEIQQLVEPSGELDWGHQVTIPSAASGTSRFYRFFLRPESNNNYLKAGGGRTINKLLILGQSGGAPRFIFNFNGIPNDGPQFSAIFDGLAPSLDTDESQSPYADGQWHALQIEVRFGGSGQALIKIWVDTDSYTNPTLANSGGSFSNATNGFIQFGSYCNSGLAPGGVYTFRHAAFRVATTFDASWHAWLTN